MPGLGTCMDYFSTMSCSTKVTISWWMKLTVLLVEGDEAPFRCNVQFFDDHMIHRRRLGAEFRGDGNRGPNFRMTFLGQNFHFNAENFWWPFFGRRPSFLLFYLSLLSQIWYVPHYMTLSLTKKLYFTTKISFISPFLVILYFFRAFLNTTSPNIGVTDAWAVPHLKF